MTKTTNYRALTEQEFGDGSGFEYQGIPLVEDEDGRFVFAWGHRDKHIYALAVNEYDEEMAGPQDVKYEAEDVQHVWAITVKPADHPDGWYIDWSDATADTPGAFGLSVVNR